VCQRSVHHAYGHTGSYAHVRSYQRLRDRNAGTDTHGLRQRWLRHAQRDPHPNSHSHLRAVELCDANMPSRDKLQHAHKHRADVHSEADNNPRSPVAPF
jgi:hypothetical protein